ncbi:uncharacterized protein TNCT_231451 [Trichonephila clavata]|uniref:Uncharacterized protein n=1 Tax=Trichonephila clavata TaxID=2740835 RepID=A0A8X6G0W6_TRICU|nr:uncharacterized protein TNCT_231451 [Trichonephila clavata]
MESMVKKMGCVHQSVSYPTNYTICEDPDVFPSEDILEKCKRECNEACWEESYSLRSEVKFDQAEKCSNDLNCEKKDMFLNFIFNRLEVEKFAHEPRYESVEMFSYIGGYMGMWLGISLVALFDFLEILFCLLFYPLRSKNKLKKIAIPRGRFA